MEILTTGQSLAQPLNDIRQAWIQVTRGPFRVNGQELGSGDGAALVSESRLILDSLEDGQVLWFDLG